MILVDSRALLWAVTDSPGLGPAARAHLTKAATRYVSAVTHAELATRGVALPDDFAARVEEAGFTPLPLEPRHAAGLAETPKAHDTFTRMLVAQAHVDGLTFITADRRLLDLGKPWIIDATK